MKEIKILVAEVLDETSDLDLEALCKACFSEETFVLQLIEEGLLTPYRGKEPEGWRFNSSALERLKRAISLHRDLEVNFAGIGVILELLDELEALRTKIEILEKK